MNHPHYRKLLRKLWAVYALCLAAIPSYLLTVKINPWNLYGALPSVAILENPKDDLSSELYATDGVLLGKYFRHNRSPAEYDELSQHLIKALLATEDYRFEEHAGIDLKSLYRAFFVSILLRRNRGGGSTLSQQLAKNLFKTRTQRYKGHLSNLPIISTLVMKTKEWIVAVQLERAYTKKEILTMYLNTVSFGSHAFGIKVAAKTFFNTTPDLLTPEQAALLIGLLKAPSRYSPIKHPARALQRRNVVLGQLHKYHLLSEEEYKCLKACPLELAYKVEDHNVGPATYFRATIRDFLLRWTRDKGYDLFEDGLKIYTTIDSRLQRHAEAAVAEHMPVLQQRFDQHWEGSNPWVDENNEEIPHFIEEATKRTTTYRQLQEQYGNDQEAIHQAMNTPTPTQLFTWDGDINAHISPTDALRYNKRLLHAGFMAMDPYTGHIKAWVGGINYKHFQYDHVMQGRRQPGSAFKPLVYAAAIDNGYTPWQEMVDKPVTFRLPTGKTWTPQNWHKRYTGQKMTLRQAMSRSVNSIIAQLTKNLGPALIVDYARRLGINSPIDPTPALCLGVADVSVYELVGAYSVFMNKGVWTKPFYITRIEDKYGRVLEEFVPQKREAISEKTAYLMIHMLQGTVEETGGSSRGLCQALREGNELCGKTGTTSNHSDGWYIGMVNGLCAGGWVGGEDRCIRFRTMAEGQGAKMARPIWEKFMLRVYDDPDLPYQKGPLLNHPKPKGLTIPEGPLPEAEAPETPEELEEELEEEEEELDTALDVNDIL